jgi:uncharacterized membrane protein (DUF373 family)
MSDTSKDTPPDIGPTVHDDLKEVRARKHQQDPLIEALTKVIRMAVRAMAVLMTLVILWGVADIIWVLYTDLTTGDDPVLMLSMPEILETFGAFMAVLIAIEIFVNITVYLRDDVIHVKIVMATALMAIARKIIILDTDKVEWPMVAALAAVVIAMSIGYYLVVVRDKSDAGEETNVH